MTPAERKKLVATIHDRVVQLLTPYGIAVQHAAGTGGDIAEFTFRIPGPGPDPTKPGRWSELTFHLNQWELQQHQTSAECMDHLPLAWARIIADEAPELFAAAPLPTAAEVDWRPTEVIPEDFGAA